MKVRWSDVLKVASNECHEYIVKNGIAPTLRGLFYILVSKNIIPNTKSAYRTLSEVVARARYLGEFPWSYIRDETRQFAWGEFGRSIADAERALNELQNLTPEEKERLLKETLQRRYEIRISRWEGQQYSVLVVVEKEAQYDAFYKIVNIDLQWDVSITTSRGFESATAVKNISEWVQSVKSKNRTPVLLLIFDWDPSGEFASIYDLVFRVLMLMEQRRGKLLEKWASLRSLDKKGVLVQELAEKHSVVFEKVMLTWEQVQKYSLPPEPQDENVKRKLLRDPRARMFMEKYGFLGQVEIDAMISLYYDETKRIIDEAIRKYFDFKAYEEVKAKEEELRRRLGTLI